MDWVWWLRRPAAAWALAGLVLLLTVALIPLSLTARGIQLATGVEIAIAVSFARWAWSWPGTGHGTRPAG